MSSGGLEAITPTPIAILRRFPLASFFVIALAFSWAVVMVVLATGAPTTFETITAITFGPAVSSLIMTAAVDGRAGVVELLRRLILWRVPFVWYAFALLGIPAIFVLGTFFLPGAAASFDALTPGMWVSYLWNFPLVVFLGGPFFEEIGWRGFALSRIEAKWGPLAGTVILGLLWAAWHYPQYLMPDWAAQNGGFRSTSVAVFTLGVLPLTVLLSWVFNNTRGSLLLAILVHASINTFSVYIGPLFPAQAGSQVNGFVGFGGAALIVIIVTAGRLGYDRYLRETRPA
jgi:CAAX protease family protein